ncbi:MAG: GntR family transcriptional regulator [Anaerolineae bacterium]
MDFNDLPRVRSTRDQIEIALSQLLKQLQPGDQLPPEPELAKQLGVSRPTLREVLRSFAERGLLVRRQGVGTFVASRLPILEAGLEVLESLDRVASRLGLETEMMHLSVAEREATDAELKGLNLGDPTTVLVVDRVIAIEDEPVADLRDVVPTRYLREADLDERFRGSILDVLLERGSPVLSISRTQIMAESAGHDHAQRLEVEVGSPLLKLVAQLYSYDEHIVDYSVSTFVPGHFRFHVMRQVRS